jgi:hypothetical protein
MARKRPKRDIVKMLQERNAPHRRKMLAERGPRIDEEPTISVPVGGPPEWFTYATFVIRRGRPVVKALHIGQEPDLEWDMPPGGLTSTDLRKIKLRVGPALDEAMESIFRERGLPVGREIARGTKGRQRRYSADEVAGFAAEYLTAVIHSPDSPRQWLTEQKRKRGHWTDGDTAEGIRRATTRGYLTPARYSGDRSPREATQKLLDWLAENEPRKGKR